MELGQIIITSDTWNVLFWCCIILVAIVILGIALLVLRRKMLSHNSGRCDSRLSMELIEKMLGDGNISLEEYKTLRRSALGLDKSGKGLDNASSSSEADGLTMNE